jgi:release factor glutamine methyltransferase
MKALEKVRDAGEFLKTSGIDNPLKDAEFIIAHCLGTEPMILYRDDPEIQENVMSLIETFLRRRAKREPLHYILGYTEFHGLKIRVGPGVLIPRPETELLVEEAISKITKLKTQNSKLRILDLCTGSGCIALALAKAFPDAEIYGIDISGAAIHYAEENAKNNGMKNVTFLKGSLFEPLTKKLTSRISHLAFDLIISNPPYIKKGDIITLQPEVRDWEPDDALNGGEDGLEYYREIMSEAINYLKRDGLLMSEIGIDQAEAVKEIARDAGFENISLKKDYAGIERIMTILQ